MKVSSLFALLFFLLALGSAVVFAENIDPDNDGSQYAYGENLGWLNFQYPHIPGVTVADSDVTGYVWAENIGWISLSCENTASCGTVNYGITNDGTGDLSGHAWAENIGWISFSCENTASCATSDYGVTIDPTTGEFDGLAWAENLGWINFAPNGVPVKTSWRQGCAWDADPPDGDVDGSDLGALADGPFDEDDLAAFAAEFGREDCQE